MLKEVLYIILLLLGFPSGIYLARTCRDEIRKWRGRLILICALGIILVGLLLILDIKLKLSIIVGLFFIIITLLTIVLKSY